MNRRQAIQTTVAACVGACLPGAAAVAGEVQTVILTGTPVYLPGPDDYVGWKNYSFTYDPDMVWPTDEEFKEIWDRRGQNEALE